MTSNQTISLVVLSFILAAGVYWYISGQTDNQPPLTATVMENEMQTQFKTLVSELKTISFDTDIFSDPNFMALTDLATQVTPEPSGRLDPFASFAGASVK